MSSIPNPTSPTKSNTGKRISFLDANPSTPPRKTSPAKSSPLNNIMASRTRAKSNPVPPHLLSPHASTGTISSPTSPSSSASSLRPNNTTSTPSGRRMSISMSSSPPQQQTPPPQRKEGRRDRLHIIFRLFDKDEDDKLNPEEMSDFLCSVFNGPETKEFLSLIESNHKDGVTFEEFVKLTRDESAASSIGKKDLTSPVKSPSSNTSTNSNTISTGAPSRQNISASPVKGTRGRSQSMAVSPKSPSIFSDYDDDDGYSEEDLKSVFSEILDVNDDGVVSMSEFKKVISNLGIQNTFSDEELSTLFEGSKTLSYEQFRKLVTM